MTKLKNLIEDVRVAGLMNVLRNEMTYALLGAVYRMNAHKDRVLATNLREMADDYDPRI